METSLYKSKSDNHKSNAQRNLCGRTHYVDDDTLRFHHSRVLASYVVDNGMLFAIVESCSLDMNNTKRGYRPVVFDVFGTVVERPDINNTHTTQKAATKAMWAFLNAFDAKAHTLAAIDRKRAEISDDLRVLATKAVTL